MHKGRRSVSQRGQIESAGKSRHGTGGVSPLHGKG